MKLSELRANVRRLEVEYYGNKLAVAYRPGEMTPESEDALREAREQNRATDAMVELMARTLVEWDVTDDDGAALPITPDTLRPFPSALLLHIMAAIQEDMVPNAMKGRR